MLKFSTKAVFHCIVEPLTFLSGVNKNLSRITFMNRLLIILFCVLALTGCIKSTEFSYSNDNHSDLVVWSCSSDEKFGSVWRCHSEDSYIGGKKEFRDNVIYGLDRVPSSRSVKQGEYFGGASPDTVWTIQLGAYSSRDAAIKHRDKYVSELSRLWVTNIKKQQKVLTLLLYGKFGNRRLAEEAASALQQLYPKLEYWIRSVNIDG